MIYFACAVICPLAIHESRKWLLIKDIFQFKKWRFSFLTSESKRLISHQSSGSDWSLVGDFRKAAFGCMPERNSIDQCKVELSVSLGRHCLRFSVQSKTCRCMFLTIASVTRTWHVNRGTWPKSEPLDTPTTQSEELPVITRNGGQSNEEPHPSILRSRNPAGHEPRHYLAQDENRPNLSAPNSIGQLWLSQRGHWFFGRGGRGLDRPASRYFTGGPLIMKFSGDAHERLSAADRSASAHGEFHSDPECFDSQSRNQLEISWGDCSSVVTSTRVSNQHRIPLQSAQ